MVTPFAIEEANTIGKRGGDNEPLAAKPAKWDRWRSVRIKVGGRFLGLATTAYSYLLTQDERVQAARRVAALWSLAAANGWSTEDIESGAVVAQPAIIVNNLTGAPLGSAVRRETANTVQIDLTLVKPPFPPGRRMMKSGWP
jgi:hypothetical protein